MRSPRPPCQHLGPLFLSPGSHIGKGSLGEQGPTGCWSHSRNLISVLKDGVTQTPDPNEALDSWGKHAASIIRQLPWYCFLCGLMVFGVKIGQLRIITAPQMPKRGSVQLADC